MQTFNSGPIDTRNQQLTTEILECKQTVWILMEICEFKSCLKQLLLFSDYNKIFEYINWTFEYIKRLASLSEKTNWFWTHFYAIKD